MSTASTVFEVLLASIPKAPDYNRDVVVPTVAILWPDEKREWDRLPPGLRLAMPYLLTLGPYAPATRTRPAIWLRGAQVGKLPDLSQPTEAVPIVYLPDVSRPTV